VRYISNYSSGKMGYALAQAAADAGAKTILISGPTALKTPEHVRRIDVISADEMLQASMDAVYKSANSCDIFIASAAVADFKPVAIAPHKIKKNDQHSMTLEMVKNPDIVATIAAQANAPFTVGFAAETQQLLEHAKSKLAKKQLDIIIANDVSNSDIGFDSDNNALTIVTKNDVFIMSQKSKKQLAVDIISYIATYIDKISPGINKI
jgi:phosphopantothenoylcysteine decarboxylase/phosphopantothenate--cysteine ligase